MEPVTAEAVTGLLVTYANHLACVAVGVVDGGVKKALGRLWEKVAARFGRDPAATGALDRLAEQPGNTRRQSAVEDRLDGALAADRSSRRWSERRWSERRWSERRWRTSVRCGSTTPAPWPSAGTSSSAGGLRRVEADVVRELRVGQGLVLAEVGARGESPAGRTAHTQRRIRVRTRRAHRP
jgi:hypothetical protein